MITPQRRYLPASIASLLLGCLLTFDAHADGKFTLAVIPESYDVSTMALTNMSRVRPGAAAAAAAAPNPKGGRRAVLVRKHG